MRLPVEGLRGVDEVAQHIDVVGSGPDQGLFGPVVQD
jgi:hypothetical protein